MIVQELAKVIHKALENLDFTSEEFDRSIINALKGIEKSQYNIYSLKQRESIMIDLLVLRTLLKLQNESTI